jgi:hypothetical protein
MKMKKLIIILSLTWLTIGCDQKKADPEKVTLQTKVDSLELALEVQSYNNVLLEQVGKYLDSIDIQRNWIEINLEQGLSESDYLARMTRLSQYVQKAEWTIRELEKTRSAYASQVKRLKQEIVVQDQELQKLLAIIESSNAENEGLSTTLLLSEDDLTAARIQILETQNKLNEVLTIGQKLKEDLAMTKAESLFRQGENKEDLAQHIQLAPKRKRKTLEQSLDLYKQSLSQGYEPARAKVETLTKRLQK